MLCDVCGLFSLDVLLLLVVDGGKEIVHQW